MKSPAEKINSLINSVVSPIDRQPILLRKVEPGTARSLRWSKDDVNKSLQENKSHLETEMDENSILRSPTCRAGDFSLQSMSKSVREAIQVKSPRLEPRFITMKIESPSRPVSNSPPEETGDPIVSVLRKLTRKRINQPTPDPCSSSAEESDSKRQRLPRHDLSASLLESQLTPLNSKREMSDSAGNDITKRHCSGKTRSDEINSSLSSSVAIIPPHHRKRSRKRKSRKMHDSLTSPDISDKSMEEVKQRKIDTRDEECQTLLEEQPRPVIKIKRDVISERVVSRSMVSGLLKSTMAKFILCGDSWVTSPPKPQSSEARLPELAPPPFGPPVSTESAEVSKPSFTLPTFTNSSLTPTPSLPLTSTNLLLPTSSSSSAVSSAPLPTFSIVPTTSTATSTPAPSLATTKSESGPTFKFGLVPPPLMSTQINLSTSTTSSPSLAISTISSSTNTVASINAPVSSTATVTTQPNVGFTFGLTTPPNATAPTTTTTKTETKTGFNLTFPSNPSKKAEEAKIFTFGSKTETGTTTTETKPVFGLNPASSLQTFPVTSSATFAATNTAVTTSSFLSSVTTNDKAKTTASLFSSGNIFGSGTTAATTTITNPVFGSTSVSNPVFGSTTTTAAVAGSTTTTTNPIFGASITTTAATTSIFGGSTTTTAGTNIFGATTTATNPMFGATTTAATNPIFGATTTTTTTKPIFGSSTTAVTKNPIFGAATTTGNPVFGAPTTTGTTNTVFGAPTTTGTTNTIFGVATTTANPGFGVATTTSVFGSLNKPVFGTTPTFGQQSTTVAATTTAATSTNLFGDKPLFTGNANSSGFGGTTMFGGSGSVFGTPTTTATTTGAAVATTTKPNTTLFGQDKDKKVGGFNYEFGSNNFNTNTNPGFGTQNISNPSFGGGVSSAPRFPSSTPSFGQGSTSSFGQQGNSSGFKFNISDSSRPNFSFTSTTQPSGGNFFQFGSNSSTAASSGGAGVGGSGPFQFSAIPQANAPGMSGQQPMFSIGTGSAVKKKDGRRPVRR